MLKHAAVQKSWKAITMKIIQHLLHIITATNGLGSAVYDLGATNENPMNCFILSGGNV